MDGSDESIIKRHTDNLAAYNAYLKGRFYWNKRTEPALKKAIEYLTTAIEEDPNYALAYSGLADSYLLLPHYGFFDPADAWPKARAAAIWPRGLRNFSLYPGIILFSIL